MPVADPSGLEEEYEILCAAAMAAGEVALGYFRTDLKITKKGDDTPVSEADYAADRVLREKLLTAFPDYGWISEESERLPGLHTSRTWIVDPIDGTRAFLHGRGDWCVAIALIENERPVLAAIFIPCSGDLYMAFHGRGATVNGKPLRASGRRTVAGCKMIGHREQFQSRKWTEPWPAMDLESYNSMAIRLAFVAEGRCDATLTLNSKSDWDLAAADLLVQEAGGIVSDIKGASFRYGRTLLLKPNVVASGAKLHGRLIELGCGWKGRKTN